MGFFDGLFGKKEKVEFDLQGFDKKLPEFIRAQGQDIARGSFGLFNELMRRGETDAEKSLFAGSRADSIRSFNDAVGNMGVNLNRRGLGSSGAADKAQASMAIGLANLLARQDAQRASQLLANRERAATTGLQNVLSVSGQGELVPIKKNKGLFDGLGTSLIGGGIKAFTGGLL